MSFRLPSKLGLLFLVLVACSKRAPTPPPTSVQVGDVLIAAPPRPWDQAVPLKVGETYAFFPEGARREFLQVAEEAGLLDVDLSDEWAPFIFLDSGGSGKEVKPNRYRETFLALANNRKSPEEIFMDSPQGAYAALSAAGIAISKGVEETPEAKKVITEARRTVRNQRDRNYLEVYGIPPTLTVLLERVDEDLSKRCLSTWDREGLAALTFQVTFQNREQAKRDYSEAIADASYVEKLLAGDRAAADSTLGEPQGRVTNREDLLNTIARDNPKHAARIERYRKGQIRLRAIRAVQARLVCEGLLTPRTKYVHGIFDLETHQALAIWERKNNVFGWGFLGGETTASLLRPALHLHLDTFRRILMERIADAAQIIEDGSAAKAKAVFKDLEGQTKEVPNLIGDYTQALIDVLGIQTPEDLVVFLRSHGAEGLSVLHLAYMPPPKPPYYEPPMQLSVEIDRGDVWYDLPFDAKWNPIIQHRDEYPSLTLFVEWEKQKIPLVRWRTTIGSWRSERHPNGKVYYKYKNSDVGPRIWKDIVAAPVWLAPDGTQAKDLVTRKVLDRNVGPVTVVNTDVIGPGFQSAYGLVLAIHHQKSGAGVWDNQIRTHGSVDYTSIARRYSHGCHRLVNNRAVRLFDFILRHREFKRIGQVPMNLRRQFAFEDKSYEYRLDSRGYYYELRDPIPVMVTEGRIQGKALRPLTAYIPKPGVDYSSEDLSSGP
jgi:hypothetical protein